MNPADLLSAMRRTVEQLAAFNEIAKALTSTLELSEVLRLVMQQVSQLLKTQSWSLLLQGDDGLLYFEICVGPAAATLKGMRITPGEGVVGKVFTSGEPRLVHDVLTDPDFAKRFDEASHFATQSVLAVPLKFRGRVLGVIEVVNGADAPEFTDDDLMAVTAVADYTAIAIENARNFQRVQELTLTDEHTGLFNTRHLHAQLEKELARCKRFGRSASLLFLDIDRFKQVNDNHGHLVGSALLKQVGQVLASGIRSIDSAYRYGGDEFAVLLLETNSEGSVTAARHMLERLRAHRFETSNGTVLDLTLSIGAASFPEHAQTATGLLEAADKAMYRAKAAGRNQVAMPAT